MTRRETPDVMGEVLTGASAAGGGAQDVALALIDDNPFQERSEYGDLTDLANDIREHGLLQAPVARRTAGGRYELAFGHRRRRACELAGMASMAVVVRELTDERMATIAFSENEQRKDVTAIDKAVAIQTMQTRFGWSLQEIADKLSMSRPAVSNLLRLLKLPDEVQTAVMSGAISARQAEALVPLATLPAQAAARLSSWDDTAALLQHAKEGKSSDWLRERAARTVEGVTRELPDHWCNYDFGELAGIEAATCTGCRCAARNGEGSTCQMVSCWDAKSAAWLGIESADAVASTGVPLLPEGVHYETRTVLYSRALETMGLEPYPARPAKLCENLRMTVNNGAGGRVQGEYVCYHPGKTKCRCLDAAERASKKDGTAFWKRLREQTLAALEARLAQFDIGALRLLTWPEMPWAERELDFDGWTVERCVPLLAQGLVKRWTPYEVQSRPDVAQREMERLLRLAGVTAIPWSLVGQIEAGDEDAGFPVL